MDAAPPGFIVKRGARGKTSADLDRAASLSSTPSITAAVSPAAAAGEDTPFGFDHVPNVTASVASFQRRCEWFYVDPSGEEHGPVPLQKIINWQKKGHFPEDVKVSTAAAAVIYSCCCSSLTAALPAFSVDGTPVHFSHCCPGVAMPARAFAQSS